MIDLAQQRAGPAGEWTDKQNAKSALLSSYRIIPLGGIKGVRGNKGADFYLGRLPQSAAAAGMTLGVAN